MPNPELDNASHAQRLPVLMYHRVGPVDGPWERSMCVEASRFREHMQALRDAGYWAVTLAECLDWLDGWHVLPPKAFLLTFDDGYRGVHDLAAPVLADLAWPATLFLVAGKIGGTDDWGQACPPRGRAYPLVDWSEIRALQRAGWDFGSHSVTHADLPTLPAHSLTQELQNSRAILEDGLMAPVTTLAYPFGRFNEAVAQAAQDAGYRAAFSTRSGFNRPGQACFGLHRLDVTGADSASVLRRKIAVGSNDGSIHKLARYVLDRSRARLQSFLWRHR